jgi:hypothetical protein
MMTRQRKKKKSSLEVEVRFGPLPTSDITVSTHFTVPKVDRSQNFTVFLEYPILTIIIMALFVSPSESLPSVLPHIQKDFVALGNTIFKATSAVNNFGMIATAAMLPL